MSSEPKNVRAAFDIQVPDDVLDDVQNAIHKNRKIICDFLIDVIARSDDDVDSSKLEAKPIAGAVHQHDVSAGKCGSCDSYSRSEVLYVV